MVLKAVALKLGPPIFVKVPSLQIIAIKAQAFSTADSSSVHLHHASLEFLNSQILDEFYDFWSACTFSICLLRSLLRRKYLLGPHSGVSAPVI